MSSNESAAYEIMRSLDVDYVLIIFGGVIGYSGDDINKFLWMVRIAEGEHPKDIRVSARLPPGARAAVKIGVFFRPTLAPNHGAQGRRLFIPLLHIHVTGELEALSLNNNSFNVRKCQTQNFPDCTMLP